MGIADELVLACLLALIVTSSLVVLGTLVDELDWLVRITPS